MEDLQKQNKLELIQGRFTQNYNLTTNGIEVTYTDRLKSEIKTLSDEVKVVIDCTGFQNLNRSSTSPLLQNLINQKTCAINASKRGFLVNENFEGNSNMYIMGPLLAGNLNKNLRVWHAESCGRIINLSKQLAEILINKTDLTQTLF